MYGAENNKRKKGISFIQEYTHKKSRSPKHTVNGSFYYLYNLFLSFRPTFLCFFTSQPSCPVKGSGLIYI